MRFVRCEQCGAKALIAASQCPRCTHPLALRDSRGEAVELAHCRQCDTFYPRSRGGCRWCGTKASASSASSAKIAGGVAVVIALVAIGAWQLRSRTSEGASRTEEPSPSQVAVNPPAPALEPPETEDLGVVPDVAVPADSAAGAAPAPDSARGGAASVTARPIAPNTAAIPPVTPPASTPTQIAARPAAAPAVTTTSGLVPAASAATPPGPGQYPGPWTRAIAEQWVNVRGSASRDAAVVGVVTPKTRVQLGELRAGWRRVRSAGIEGWADSRYFSADSTRR